MNINFESDKTSCVSFESMYYGQWFRWGRVLCCKVSDTTMFMLSPSGVNGGTTSGVPSSALSFPVIPEHKITVSVER